MIRMIYYTVCALRENYSPYVFVSKLNFIRQAAEEALNAGGFSTTDIGSVIR